MSKLNNTQKIGIAIVLIASAYCLFTIYKYWSADVLYAQAKAEIELGMISESARDLADAIAKSPKEPLYHDRLAQVYSAVAKAQVAEKDASSAAQLAKAAINEADIALSLGSKNFVVLQNRVNIYSDLAAVNPKYTLESIKTLEYLAAYAPTYAKVYYKLGLAYLSIGQTDRARQNLQKALELKPNYEEAKNALATLQKPQ